MEKSTRIQRIAALLSAIKNCEKSGNQEWLDRHNDELDAIERDLPSGSGFDNSSVIDRERSGPKAIYIETAFHHMNDAGYYDGWTEHTIKVTPSFDGFDLRISGRNRNDIKDYIGDTFHYALSEEV